MDLAAAHVSLVAALYKLRNADGGWPYYSGRKSRLEPTSWAMLGTGSTPESTPLGGWAQPDGLLIEPGVGSANFGFNGVAALALGSTLGATRRLTDRIVAALVDVRGNALPPSPAIRQNNSLQGWPWMTGTFSWIEPTAWCMLAVKKAGSRSVEAGKRISVAEDIMRDRECQGGGWNVGNAQVFGQSLPAHVPPTAIGVLALQDRAGEPMVINAARFLEAHAITEASTSALALSALALSSVGRPSSAIVSALAERQALSETFGNIAALGMAAYALESALLGRQPEAFTLTPADRQ